MDEHRGTPVYASTHASIVKRFPAPVLWPGIAPLLDCELCVDLGACVLTEDDDTHPIGCEKLVGATGRNRAKISASSIVSN